MKGNAFRDQRVFEVTYFLVISQTIFTTNKQQYVICKEAGCITSYFSSKFVFIRETFTVWKQKNMTKCVANADNREKLSLFCKIQQMATERHSGMSLSRL
jgi:hypothetical protein